MHADRPHRCRSSRRLGRGIAVCALLMAALAFGAGQASAQSAGQVAFERNATSSFDTWLVNSTPEQREWMGSAYSRMRGYPPFFDRALPWSPSSDFYIDLYAMYDLDYGSIPDHPEWVLRDRDGRRLFVPNACDGERCAAYAADIGSPTWRADWIARARREIDKGYHGIFIDNVSMDMMVGNGSGNLVRPVDPRTGQPMTDNDWRRYVAEFTEEIRAAFPDAVITHNSGQWWADESDPFFKREVDAADRIELERGFADTGIGYGGGMFGYETYLKHVDWIHGRGASFIAEPYGLDRTSAAFELASFFLVSEAGDGIASSYRSNPDNWWSGWATDLGEPQGDRYDFRGALRRDFSNGIVLVNQPSAQRRTIDLPDGTWTDLDGDQVRSVTLGPRQGAVLRGESSEGPAVTMRADRRRVRRGATVRLEGAAPGAGAVDVSVRRDGEWRLRMASVPVTEGSYEAALPARGAGLRRFRATAAGLEASKPVRVSVRHRHRHH